MHLEGYFNFTKSGLSENSHNLNYRYKDDSLLLTVSRFELRCTYFDHEYMSVFFLRTKNQITEKVNLKTLKASGEKPVLLPEAFSVIAFHKELSSHAQPVCVIWLDEDNNAIYIARDTFGLIPLYFLRSSANLIAFSTNIGSLLRHRDISCNGKINYSRINKYLQLSDANSAYNSETCFSDISAVLPSHFACITENDTKLQPYVEYSPEKYEGFGSIEDFGKVFRELLLNSVGRSVQDLSVMGAQLSGGLDSSSIISCVRFLKPESKLYTFHFKTNTSWSDEDQYAQQVADFIRSDHLIISPSYTFIDKIIKNITFNAQPLYSLGAIGLNIDSIKSAFDHGCDALFTGYDGDSVVGYGRKEYFTQLFEKKEWNLLDTEMSSLALRNHHSISNPGWDTMEHSRKKFLLIRYQFYEELKKSAGKFSFRESLDLLYYAFKNFGIPPAYLIKKIGKDLITKLKSKGSVPYSFHRKSFIEEAHNNHPKSTNFRDTLKGKNLIYHENIMVNQNIRILEDFFCMSQQQKLSVRHPFFDKDLYELNLAVPAGIKFGQGFERGQHREAMKGILPEAVRTRTTKGFGNQYVLKAARILFNQSQDFLQESGEVWQFIDRKEFLKGIKLMESDGGDSFTYHTLVFNVTRTIYLAIWLDMYKRNAFLTKI
ncbi:hypothetical protein DYBT9275_03960 [Dyadobacter sp. CECT 9275]|uniref:asparagine synthase (glutamine-hydrolyzing) n=1 Tax=Dyadobacter helix TaxID=2822344 RepID=A0A916NMJ8_9BACT|nr:asparagine synthetase B family protein [Dyadobacter sp. CECT 9275]CAG5007084.1 hypothetical protein DYBT9275_03960 [Dyadobacter sp. CECT 9275]